MAPGGEVEPVGAQAKRVPRAVREQQMLDAAVAAFARRGYRSASMDEIAVAAGVSKPLVYLYLNSKDDLFATCLRREAAALKAAVRAGVDPGAPAERQLWGGLLAFFEYTAARPDGWAVLQGQARTPGEPFAAEVAAMRAEFVEFVRVLIASAAGEAGCAGVLAERETAGVAHALVGAAESLAGWSTGPAAPREAAATMMNVVWNGLSDFLHGHRWTGSS